MKRWYTTDELLTKWDMQPFEIIALIRNESLHPYARNAEKEKKIKQAFTDNEIRLLIDSICNRDINIPDTINARISQDFQGEHFDEGAFNDGSELQEFLCKLVFKAEDISDYEKSVKKTDTQQTFPTQQPIQQDDAETFVRSIRVYYLTDSEIKISTGGNPKTYTREELGFKKAPDLWRDFLKIIKSNHHSYYTGKAHGADRQRHSTYDADQKRLSRINDKVVLFLNKSYGKQLPKGFKIYEHPVNERHGIYKFKFQIINSTLKTQIVEYNQCSQPELIKIIQELSTSRSDLAALKSATGIAQEKGWLGERRVKDYINGTIEE